MSPWRKCTWHFLFQIKLSHYLTKRSVHWSFPEWSTFIPLQFCVICQCPDTGAASGGWQGGGGAIAPLWVLAFFFFACQAQSRTVMMIIPLLHYGNNFGTNFFGWKKKCVGAPPPPPPPPAKWLFSGLAQCSHEMLPFCPPPPPSKHPAPPLPWHLIRSSPWINSRGIVICLVM